jgi:hypothetical protein
VDEKRKGGGERGGVDRQDKDNGLWGTQSSYRVCAHLNHAVGKDCHDRDGCGRKGWFGL